MKIIITIFLSIASTCLYITQTPTNELVKQSTKNIYTIAIEDFVNQIKEYNNSTFDTLFFGKHLDFPDANLPTNVNNTKIILLLNEDIEKFKPHYSKRNPYINLISYIHNQKFEFIFNTFYPGFDHQYDCYLTYNIDSTGHNFKLVNSRLQVFKAKTATQPEHFEYYENGKEKN